MIYILTICFTGHRPNKLYGYDWKSEGNRKLMNSLCNTILNTLQNEWSNNMAAKPYNEVRFIFGGALGVDQMAFEVCYQISNIYDGYYELYIAIPFEGQERKWNKEDVERYQSQLQDCDKIIVVDKLNKYALQGVPEGDYHPAKMQKRNEYMVDNSDIVIAVWDGTKGGTYNRVKYAEKLGKRIIRINPKEM